MNKVKILTGNDSFMKARYINRHINIKRDYAANAEGFLRALDDARTQDIFFDARTIVWSGNANEIKDMITPETAVVCPFLINHVNTAPLKLKGFEVKNFDEHKHWETKKIENLIGEFAIDLDLQIQSRAVKTLVALSADLTSADIFSNLFVLKTISRNNRAPVTSSDVEDVMGIKNVSVGDLANYILLKKGDRAIDAYNTLLEDNTPQEIALALEYSFKNWLLTKTYACASDIRIAEVLGVKTGRVKYLRDEVSTVDIEFLSDAMIKIQNFKTSVFNGEADYIFRGYLASL